MSAANVAVVLIGAALIVWVNWYFLAPRAAVAAKASGGAQTIEVEVRGGYNPGTIRVKRGAPVHLVFNRQETSSCSEEVVLADFGVRQFLPAFQKTDVTITPDRTGKFDITCGMSMLHGTLIVED